MLENKTKRIMSLLMLSLLFILPLIAAVSSASASASAASRLIPSTSMTINDNMGDNHDGDQSDPSNNDNMDNNTDTQDDNDIKAGDMDKDGINDTMEEEFMRDVKVSIKSDEAEIKSDSDKGDTIDFKIELDDDGVKLELQYQANNESNNIELNQEIKFNELIEFRDNNNNNIYDPNSDTVLSVKSLDSFNSPLYANKTLSDRSTIHNINISTSDNVFKLEFYIPEEFSIINNTLVTPTQMKFNIIINGFNFSAADSKLALNTELQTESEFEFEHETENEKAGFVNDTNYDEEGIRNVAGNYIGEFTWEKSALIDGVLKNITTSGLINEDNETDNLKINIIYPHGNYIFHDPTFGVALVSLSFNNPGSLQQYIIYIILAIALIGAIPIVLKLRRRV